MLKKLIPILVPVLAFALEPLKITKKEQYLINHVKESIARGDRKESNLPREILNLEGMSSDKVRHFLNNLCNFPDISYLEIGCYKGSTWVSSMYQNQNNMKFALAIDNWSQFGRQKEVFLANCKKYLGDVNCNMSFDDAFKLDLQKEVLRPFNIYFYDGDHSEKSQELAFTYYNDVLEDVFVAIVDDWNWDYVQRGTRTAFEKLGYTILYEAELPSRFNCDRENWWNGLYVAVIRK